MFPTKFQVSWPFGSGEEAKNRFSRWWPSWISNWNNFSYFLSTSHHDAAYQVSSHLGFLIGTILAIFYLPVTLMLRTKFQVNWPFGSGEEAQK